MQTATVLVALAGNRGNTVPKVVTPAEALVLLAIHGEGSVFDVNPSDEDLDRDVREEAQRLHLVYRQAKDPEGDSIVRRIIPNASAVPSTFDEITFQGGADLFGLTESDYVATTRKAPKKATKKPSTSKTAKKAQTEKAEEDSQSGETEEDDKGGTSDVMG